MDVHVTRLEERFVWDSEKASTNFAKHGVSFDEATEVFFDTFYHLLDASTLSEAREAAIGFSSSNRLLFVIHIEIESETTRIISARPATNEERRHYEELA